MYPRVIGLVVMATEIRGTMDDSTRMIAGQVRKIFDPDWIQGFDTGGITVQFMDEPTSAEELVRFMKMYGHDVRRDHSGDSNWYRYYFE